MRTLKPLEFQHYANYTEKQNFQNSCLVPESEQNKKGKFLPLFIPSLEPSQPSLFGVDIGY